MSIFNPSDFVIDVNHLNDKKYKWLKLSIACELISATSPWYLKIEGINGYAEEELRLECTIGSECNQQTVAQAMTKMFDNPYIDAYHKTIKGILNGMVIGEYLYLGIK